MSTAIASLREQESQARAKLLRKYREALLADDAPGLARAATAAGKSAADAERDLAALKKYAKMMAAFNARPTAESLAEQSTEAHRREREAYSALQAAEAAYRKVRGEPARIGYLRFSREQAEKRLREFRAEHCEIFEGDDDDS